MTADEQGDDQAADDAVLADDGLAHLGAQRVQGLAGVSGAACLGVGRLGLVSLTSVAPLLDPVQVVGQGDERSLVGGHPTVEEAPSPLPGRARPCGQQLSERRCRVRVRGVRRHPQQRRQPLNGRPSELVRGSVACLGPAVEPGPPLGDLGGPDHDRQRLLDDRSEPAGAPRRRRAPRDAELEDRGADPVGQQVAQGLAGSLRASPRSTGSPTAPAGPARGGSSRARRCPAWRGGRCAARCPDPSSVVVCPSIVGDLDDAAGDSSVVARRLRRPIGLPAGRGSTGEASPRRRSQSGSRVRRSRSRVRSSRPGSSADEHRRRPRALDDDQVGPGRAHLLRLLDGEDVRVDDQDRVAGLGRPPWSPPRPTVRRTSTPWSRRTWASARLPLCVGALGSRSSGVAARAERPDGDAGQDDEQPDPDGGPPPAPPLARRRRRRRVRLELRGRRGVIAAPPGRAARSPALRSRRALRAAPGRGRLIRSCTAASAARRRR